MPQGIWRQDDLLSCGGWFRIHAARLASLQLVSDLKTALLTEQDLFKWLIFMVFMLLDCGV
jgi:hypothetical protein